MALYFCVLIQKKDSDLEAIAESLLRFTPDIALRRHEPRAIFLEVGRCMALYSERSLELRIQSLLREWKLTPEQFRLAKASSLPRAWLSARQGIRADKIDSTPISMIDDIIDPLGEYPEERGRVRAMAETLFTLGIRRIGNLKKLPPDSAASRFGERFERLLRNLEETDTFTWERFRGTERFLERIDLDAAEPIWELEPVLFHAKNLLDRILKRAFGRGKALVEMELRLECERRRASLEIFTKVRLRFTFPQNSSITVLRSLREKLAHEFSRRELDAPILALEFEALELAPRESLQENFMDREGVRAEAAAQGFRDLVSELGTKLTSEKEMFQAEVLAAWRPERSWKKVLKDPTRLGGASIPIPTRPLRILNPPEALRRLGRYLFWDKTRFTIREFSQVERLSGEWWEDDGGFTRTYYQVQVEETGGELRSFWIFREQKSAETTGGLFIHGVY